jgi:hypothetical protein
METAGTQSVPAAVGMQSDATTREVTLWATIVSSLPFISLKQRGKRAAP